jgi:hypothetical protein
MQLIVLLAAAAIDGKQQQAQGGFQETRVAARTARGLGVAHVLIVARTPD